MRNVHIRLCVVLWTRYGRQKHRSLVDEDCDGLPETGKAELRVFASLMSSCHSR